MKHYQALVFDWEGTLTNPEERTRAVLKETLQEMGGEGYCEHLDAGASPETVLGHVRTECSGFDESLFQTIYQRAWAYAQAKPMPVHAGLKAFLLELKAKGYRLAVATGHSRRGLNESLAFFELEACFETTMTAEESCSKPSPQMLECLQERMDLSAEALLMIGDSAVDVEMGQAAQVDTVLLHADESLKTALNPTYVLQNLFDLPGILFDSSKTSR